jgi:molybdate transport system substrate-binding protein
MRSMKTASLALAGTILSGIAATVSAIAGPELHVLMSGGFSAAYREVLPTFERTTGIAVNTAAGGSQGQGPNTIGAQLRRGVLADVVIMSKEGLEELAQERRVVADTVVDLAQTQLGLAVRVGAPKPDIGTVDAFKQTLLRAKSITFPTSTTGIYMTTTMFPRLGIADEVAKKYVTGSVAAVVTGDAELAIPERGGD